MKVNLVCINNKLLIGEDSNKISFRDNITANVYWEKTLESPVAFDFVILEKSQCFYLALENGKILAINFEDGEVLWTCDTSGALFGNFTIKNDYIYGVKTANKIFKINLYTGQLVYHVSV